MLSVEKKNSSQYIFTTRVDKNICPELTHTIHLIWFKTHSTSVLQKQCLELNF